MVLSDSDVLDHLAEAVGDPGRGPDQGRPGRSERPRAITRSVEEIAEKLSAPWAGYDELTASEIQAVLAEGDDERAARVRTYELSHKNRAGVIKTAEREGSSAR